MAESVYATIIHIPADYPAIQQGIDASTSGDTVLVGPGTYVENINFNGHNIVLGSLFLTTGDTSYVQQTVIDGNRTGSVIVLENGEDNSAIIAGFTISNGRNNEGGGIYCLQSKPVIRDNAIIDNIAVTRGAGIFFEDCEAPEVTSNLITGNDGSGIYCLRSDAHIADNNILDNEGGIRCRGISNPVIENNRIIANSTSFPGGGIYCVDYSSPLINANIIDSNYAPHGGGIYCLDSNPEIIGNEISWNMGDSSGGIKCEDSYAVIKGNTITFNISEDGGGGIDCESSASLIDQNTIRGNIGRNGGGISLTGDLNGGDIHIINFNLIVSNFASNVGGGVSSFYAAPLLYNNSVWDNKSVGIGGGFYLLLPESTRVRLTNIISWENISETGASEIYTFPPNPYSQNYDFRLIYSDIRGGAVGFGNIDTDPLFRDPENGDFHLMSIACGYSANSPCIDAGNPNLLDSLLGCSWGLGGPRSDMGAYGGGDSLTTDIVEILPPLPGRIILLQNYPNPFNAWTTIRFVLPEPGDVKMTIYDLLGRRVETIVDAYMQDGIHKVSFDASRFSSGVYFYRLQTNDRAAMKRMLLLK